MNRPWMPLYIADYLADTAHLRAAQSGAYLHLIMHYWQVGGLPDDDAQLASIAKMTLSEWRRNRQIVSSFFDEGWRHKRIEQEIFEAEVKYQRRAAAGRKGGKSPKQEESNASALLNQPPPPETKKKEDGGGGGAVAEPNFNEPIDEQRLFENPRWVEAQRVADELAIIAGHSPPKVVPRSWCGAALRVLRWIDHGWPPEIILMTAKGVMQSRPNEPLASVNYFEQAIARAVAEKDRPVPIATGQTSEKRRAETSSPVSDAIRQNIARGVSLGPRPTGIVDPGGGGA